MTSASVDPQSCGRREVNKLRTQSVPYMSGYQIGVFWYRYWYLPLSVKLSNLCCSLIFIDEEEMRQELYKWYDKKYPDTGAVFHFDIVLKWQVETTALNSDFLNENGPILSMIIIGLIILPAEFIFSYCRKSFHNWIFVLHLDAKQLNRVTSVMWLYSHAQWQMSINNWLNHCIRMMFFIYITPIIEGYFMEENRNTTISDQG